MRSLVCLWDNCYTLCVCQFLLFSSSVWFIFPGNGVWGCEEELMACIWPSGYFISLTENQIIASTKNKTTGKSSILLSCVLEWALNSLVWICCFESQSDFHVFCSLLGPKSRKYRWLLPSKIWKRTNTKCGSQKSKC